MKTVKENTIPVEITTVVETLEKGGFQAYLDGGNEVFCDGSASWNKFQTMWRLTRFSGVSATDIYWYQDSSDFDATLTAKLPNLK